MNENSIVKTRSKPYSDDIFLQLDKAPAPCSPDDFQLIVWLSSCEMELSFVIESGYTTQMTFVVSLEKLNDLVVTLGLGHVDRYVVTIFILNGQTHRRSSRVRYTTDDRCASREVERLWRDLGTRPRG
jgi:hypothetical protein